MRAGSDAHVRRVERLPGSVLGLVTLRAHRLPAWRAIRVCPRQALRDRGSKQI